MLSHSPTLVPTTDFSPEEENLLAELQKVLVPFAEIAGVSLGVCTGSAPNWLTVNADCTCAQQALTTTERLAQSCQPDRFCRVWPCGQLQLLACLPLAHGQVASAIEHLIALLEQNLSLVQQEEQLLDELSASWESLEAVYEISSDLGLLTEPEPLLERILHRAASFRSGLKTVLWLERDGICHPMTNSVTELTPRLSTDGLLGQVLTERNGLILNGRARILEQPNLEPEFQAAFNLALVPLTSRNLSLGVMAVWQEERNVEFDSHDTRFLAALALQAAMVIENDRLYRAALGSERLRQEIEIGSTIQQTLLSSQVPADFPGLEIAALTLPSQLIDGDFFDFITPREKCLDVISGDVMGKGIPAALVGAATKNAFLRALSQLVSVTAQWRLPEPHEIVTLVNREVVKQLITLESFVTLCYARFDLATQQARIVDCGHTWTVLYRPSTRTCELLKGDNLPIGFSESEVYEQSSYPLEPGALFFFYSDGLTETTNAAGEAFGETRLVEFIERHNESKPEALINAALAALLAFAGRPELGDDLTCVAVRILPTLKHFPTQLNPLHILSDLSNLELCRTYVRQVCQLADPATLEEDLAYHLELAVTEAVANVMKHAYKGQTDQPIELSAVVEAARIILTIRHQGLPFVPTEIPLPVFDGSKEGGFGLFIINKLMDEVIYSSEPDGNRIKLIKTFNGAFQNASNV
jgi:sigma-B regulation protein RsbU (phosphoserine phosphatase)